MNLLYTDNDQNNTTFTKWSKMIFQRTSFLHIGEYIKE